MTVSYSHEVATATLGTFGKLLFRWKASVYKLVWKEMILYVVVYISIAAVYQHVLDCPKKRYFEGWVKYSEERFGLIPLTFVLGFYVSVIIERWWGLFSCIGWPDRSCFFVSMCMPSREMIQYRRVIARYLNLAQLLVLRDVSTAVKTRFPTMDKIASDGFMTAEERVIFDKIKADKQLEASNMYWVVIQWCCNILCRAQDRNGVRDQMSLCNAIKQIVAYRESLSMLLAYDWICVPISYTQVVTLVTYAYFVTALLVRQFTENAVCCEEYTDIKRCSGTTDLSPGAVPFNQRLKDQQFWPITIQQFVPIFPILEFLFYMGWLKVAESIMNPLGQDDDDFEINYIIDRNLAVSYAIVDAYHDNCPEVKRERGPNPLASKVKARSYRGSATGYNPSHNPDGTKKPKGKHQERKKAHAPTNRKLFR